MTTLGSEGSGPESVLTADRPSDEAIREFYAGMRPYWHPVLASEDLTDGTLKEVTILGVPVLLARLDGEVSAMMNFCKHYQAKLSLGRIVTHKGRQCVQCPYHGWTYGADGAVVRIPQLPEGRSIPNTARVESYLARERYGLIWLCMGSDPGFDIPAFPEFEDESFRVVSLKEEVPTKSSATRMIMGTLDNTHFPWVHEGILGEPTDSPMPAPDHKVWRDGQYLVLQYDILQPANRTTTDVTAHDEDGEAALTVTYTDYVGMPNVIRLVKDGDAGRYVVWLATCPVSYNRTRNFWAFARNYDLSPESDGDYTELAAIVRAQDKPIIESQRPWLMAPFASKLVLPLGPADLPLMEYQKWLEELKITTRV